MEILTQFVRVGPTSPTVFSDPLSRSRRVRSSGREQKEVLKWIFEHQCYYSSQTDNHRNITLNSFNFLYLKGKRHHISKFSLCEVSEWIFTLCGFTHLVLGLDLIVAYHNNNNINRLYIIIWQMDVLTIDGQCSEQWSTVAHFI